MVNFIITHSLPVYFLTLYQQFLQYLFYQPDLY